MRHIRGLGFSRTSRIPIALLLLIRQKSRFITAIIGLVFATVLIHAQLGILEALFDSSVRFYNALDAEVFIISKNSLSSAAMESFDESKLIPLQSYKQIERVSPIGYRYARWRTRQSKDERLAMLVGIEPEDKVFKSDNWFQKQQLLIKVNRAIFDRLSRSEYKRGLVIGETLSRPSMFLNDYPLKIEGTIDIGTSFGVDASVVTSLDTFSKLLYGSYGSKNRLIEMGAIKLMDGIGPDELVYDLAKALPSDLIALTKDQLNALEKEFWADSKPIGFVFSFNVILGFLVGFSVVYQVLCADISRHLTEFSVMLSFSFRKSYLRTVVVRQSLWLCLVSYPIGTLISLLIYMYINYFTSLPLAMTFGRILFCFLIVFLMCISSAVLAINKLSEVNPRMAFDQ